MVGEDIVCDAVEGRFLHEPSVAALHTAARQAEFEGIHAVFLTDGPLGDAMVLAAGLSGWTTELLLGVRTGVGQSTRRHPTLLAREMTTLDLISGGRALLSFTPPFTAATVEAMALCRQMWRDGFASSEGPLFPVPGAVNRPRPDTVNGPPIALDLTDGSDVPPGWVTLADFLLMPHGPDRCLLQPT